MPPSGPQDALPVGREDPKGVPPLRRREGSLRRRILLPPLLLLGCLLGAAFALGARWVREVSEGAAQLRAQAVCRSLAAAPELPLALARAQADRVDRLLARALEADGRLAFLALQAAGPAGRGGPGHLALRPDEEGGRLGAHREALLGLPERVHGPALRTIGGVPMALAPQPVHAPRAPDSEVEGPALGALLCAVSTEREGEAARAGLQALLGLGAAGLLSYLIVVLSLLGAFSRRVEQLYQGARRIGQGDLLARIGGYYDAGELGEVGRAFDAAAERVARTLAQLRAIAQSLERAARDVVESSASVQRGVGAQLGDADDALKSARGLSQALGGAVKQIDAIREEVRLSANVIQRLSGLSQDAAAAAEEAERAVAVIGESTAQSAGVIGDVARQAGELGDAAGRSASSMIEVRQSIGRVRETASSAALLAEQAGIDAERGSLILGESLAGMEHIRQASRAISAVTDDLQQRVGEIGDVLHLITELTQRTNLLALNASIIAAQAGAEGRGFAVVADEIKDLARRTANSAGSIDTLIQALAEGAQAARRAAMAGGEAVEAGATRARDAARTMGDVLQRLRSWTQLARSIAAVTDDQARSAAQVMRSIQEVQAHAGEIATRSAEQSRRADYVMRQESRLQELVGALAGGVQEQREGSAQVADALGRLVHIVDELGGAERGRVAESERVRGLLEMMRRVLAGHRDTVAALGRATADLQAQAQALGAELGRLK